MKILGIFIPTCEKLAYNMDIFNFYENHGYISSPYVDISIIEEASCSMIDPSVLPQNINYYRNPSQVGLHESWYHIVTALSVNYKWTLVLGDTDYLEIKLDRLLNFLQECESRNSFALILDNVPNVYKSKYINDLIKSTSAGNLLHFRSDNYFPYSCLVNSFSYVSNVIFRNSSLLQNHCIQCYKSIAKSDCFHFITLYSYALKYNTVISFLPINSSNYIKIFISEPLVMLKKNRLLTPCQRKYLESIAIMPQFYNLYIWVIAYQGFCQCLPRFVTRPKTKTLRKLVRRVILRSFFNWFIKTNSFGLLPLSKLLYFFHY